MEETLKGKIANVDISELIKDKKLLNISIDRVTEERFISIEIRNKEELEKSNELYQDFIACKEMKIDYSINPSLQTTEITGKIQGEAKYDFQVYRPHLSVFYKIKQLEKCS